MGGGIVRNALIRADMLAVFGLVLVASWAFVAWMTMDMSHPFIMLMMPLDSSWTWATLIAVFLMWSGMMVAMMLPTAAPMILTLDSIERRKVDEASATARTLLFAAAYLAIWIIFSALATAAQWFLQYVGLLTPMIASKSHWLTAALLLLAGAYQLTSLKQACLGNCRTPIGFLLTEWRDGPDGAWKMGLKHGLYCMGCCWALMLLLFVAGAMNPIWIAFLAVLAAIEKWPRLPTWTSSFLGVILMAVGAAHLL